MIAFGSEQNISKSKLASCAALRSVSRRRTRARDWKKILGCYFIPDASLRSTRRVSLWANHREMITFRLIPPNSFIVDRLPPHKSFWFFKSLSPLSLFVLCRRRSSSSNSRYIQFSLLVCGWNFTHPIRANHLSPLSVYLRAYEKTVKRSPKNRGLGFQVAGAWAKNNKKFY